jgi:NTP pyrophosphatase (non-canonical NTP hydrolase)
MRDAVEKVRAFQKKRGLPTLEPGELGARELPPPSQGLVTAVRLLRMAEFAIREQHRLRPGDLALARVRYTVEETLEMAEALERRDQRAFADAVADLLYIGIGNGLSFGVPVAEAFAEVHSSNMTKGGLTADGKGGKGEDYREPRIDVVLWAARLGHSTSGEHCTKANEETGGPCGGLLYAHREGWLSCSACG